MVSVPTTCPFCACGCGFFLQARDGELVGIAPSESHPVAAGKICARGWSAHEAPLWGNRILQPMIRRLGTLEQVSWDTALDYTEQRIRNLMETGKPVGVLGSARATNEENYLAGRLARAGLQTNHVDFCSHALCRPVIAGFEDVIGGPAHSIRLTDIESSDTIVLIEGDLAETHPRAASSVLKALERGARLIAIGCARTQMARVASSFLETAPGSEGEAINGLLAAAVHLARVGGGEASAAGGGYEPLRQALKAVSTSALMDVAAEWIAAAERAVFLMGPTAGRPVQLRRDAAALATLAATTGHLGRPKSGLLPLLGRSNVRGACDMGVAPDRLPGYERIDDGEARQRVQSVWGKAAPTSQGLDAEKMLLSISGLIVLADDPAAVLPRGQRAREALERMEFVVVLDAFMTPAVSVAHAVLPVASFAETDGTITNMEGRVQRVRAATTRPGEAMDGWLLLGALCARFGAGGAWNSAAEVFQEITRAAPRYAGIAPQVFDEGWGSPVLAEPERASFTLRATATETSTSAEYPYVLARDGAFDWGSDPHVSLSPTLHREYQSERKLFPNGFVVMSPGDSDALGVRPGWRVKLTSAYGEAIVPVQQREGLRRGALLAPYGFRDSFANVLDESGAMAVNVERV